MQQHWQTPRDTRDHRHDFSQDPALVFDALLHLLNANRPKWHRRAACRGVGPDVFFTPSRHEEAAAMCAACPVRETCLEDALRFRPGDDHGFRGGLTDQQRRELRRTRAA